MASSTAPRDEVAHALAHLRHLARLPRPAGGVAESAARAHCREVLARVGFEVTEEVFEYSTLPGRFATPAAGVWAIVVLALAGQAGYRGRAALALAVLFVGGALAGFVGGWISRRGVLTLPWGRSRSINLQAMRAAAGTRPDLWLVAHLDSKSQPIPILVRVVGVIALIVVSIGAAMLALSQLAGAPVQAGWPWVSGIGALSALPVVLSLVGSRSPGALDDASGVATALLVASSMPSERPLGLLLTSAEELGLAGARAWAAGHPAATAINLDGIDDDGGMRITYSRRRSAHLIRALQAPARRRGVPVSTARLVPGALVDGIALADAGWDVVTVSRGTLATVWRIHTSRDGLATVTGEGVATVAAIVREALEELD